MKKSVREEVKKIEKRKGRNMEKWDRYIWRDIFVYLFPSEDFVEEFKDKLDWEDLVISERYEKYCKDKKRKKSTLPIWYERKIEPTVRDVVKLLRDNGINTECSCGHEKYVQCQCVNEGFIERVDGILFVGGFRNYKIELSLVREDGHLRDTMHIYFKDMEEMEKK